LREEKEPVALRRPEAIGVDDLSLKRSRVKKRGEEGERNEGGKKRTSPKLFTPIQRPQTLSSMSGVSCV